MFSILLLLRCMYTHVPVNSSDSWISQSSYSSRTEWDIMQRTQSNGIMFSVPIGTIEIRFCLFSYNNNNTQVYTREGVAVTQTSTMHGKNSYLSNIGIGYRKRDENKSLVLCKCTCMCMYTIMYLVLLWKCSI